ncbi:MAG TPA: DUF5069 domain-containing protein [Verrucomicrobiales bacterium]|jgi:hypothetical protein|nr:DUF5069 domain-containing protein [Verrucomicrobiales bacterium]
MIHDIRRSYFRENQKSHPSPQTLLPGDLSARAAEAAGIQWLPRIIAKAKAKLRGELDADIMYCCGGDRHFLKQVDIHPAEFLRMIKNHETDEQAIIDWVTQRASR